MSVPPPGGNARAIARIVVASAALLFIELLVVRWTGSELSRLAFFKNLVLIAAFLGGGLGMAAAGRVPRFRWVAPPLLVVFGIGVPLAGRSRTIQELGFGTTHEAHWQTISSASLLNSAAFLLFFVSVFAVSLILFVALGVAVGRTLAGTPPLTAYLANLAGSLAGVAAFAAVSLLSLSPWTWLLVAALPLGWAVDEGRGLLLAASGAVAAGVLTLALSDGVFWSLYSRIAVTRLILRATPPMTAYELSVDRAYFMNIIDLRPSPGAPQSLVSARFHYELPYRFLEPRSVLVLGSGGGNDVAAALRAGVPSIDAVEIDPAIVRFGQGLHPERPYQSPRVRTFVDDARSFLKTTDRTYDLVVLGLLDSHTLLSGLPGVRLDNYVYTVESLRDVRRHLNPGGLLVLSFAVAEDRRWLALKIDRMVEEAFGEPPLVFDARYDLSKAFVAGPGLGSPRARAAADELRGSEVSRASLEALLAEGRVDIPTDDWPHLYLRQREVPGGQLLLIVLLLIVSAAAARALVPLTGPPEARFAWLGAGFLLVETKGVSDLGLLFGGTWWTVTATVFALLAMALLSTIYVARKRPTSTRPFYVGLFVTLAAGFLLRPGTLLALPLPAARGIGAVLVAIPVFFSGAVFAISLRETRDTAHALGSNLLGAVLGGFLEYASLAFGVRSLSVVAIVLYALSAVSRPRSA